MATNNRVDVAILKADGTPADESGLGYLLLAATTYYALISDFTAIGGLDDAMVSAHLIGDAALILTSVEVEDGNLSEASVTSVVAGEWVKENPSGAYVACVGNCSAVNLVAAKTAGAIGAAMFNIGNTGARRTRLKFTVGAAGGVARVAKGRRG